MQASIGKTTIRFLTLNLLALSSAWVLVALPSNALGASAYVEACKTYCPDPKDDKAMFTCMEEVEKAKKKDSSFKASRCSYEHEKYEKSQQ